MSERITEKDMVESFNLKYKEKEWALEIRRSFFGYETIITTLIHKNYPIEIDLSWKSVEYKVKGEPIPLPKSLVPMVTDAIMVLEIISGIRKQEKKEKGENKMKTIEHLRDYLLESYVNEFGNLDISGLDFSDFEGDVDITGMKVEGSLCQGGQKVGNHLYQSGQEVKGNLYQSWHEIQGDYTCENVQVKGDIYTNDPTKLLKEVTSEELAKLGYKIKGEN